MSVERLSCDGCGFTCVATAATKREAVLATISEARRFGFEVGPIGLVCRWCKERLMGALFGHVEDIRA